MGYNLRGADELGGAGGQTVFDDGSQDLLVGGANQDWFLANRIADGGGVQVLDVLIDLAANETASDIDFDLL
jgi:hypothetical protein